MPPLSENNDDLLVRTFARLHATALGIACGVLAGLGILMATVVLLLKGGQVVGPNLSLLAQYFPGYRVTWSGAFIGAGYGLLVGFGFGFALASLRNVSLSIYLHAVRLWANLSANHFLDRFDS